MKHVSMKIKLNKSSWQRWHRRAESAWRWRYGRRNREAKKLKNAEMCM